MLIFLRKLIEETRIGNDNLVFSDFKKAREILFLLCTVPWNETRYWGDVIHSVAEGLCRHIDIRTVHDFYQ